VRSLVETARYANVTVVGAGDAEQKPLLRPASDQGCTILLRIA
jgi:hypothetical protein